MTNVPVSPPIRRNTLRNVVYGTWKPDPNGIASTEKVVERIVDAYKLSLKQSNQLLAISLGLALLYSIKVIGLRIDLVIFDQKVFKLPYGLFIFCIASQLTFAMGCVRFLDQRVFDRYLRAVCDKEWGDQADFIYQTLKGGHDWTTTAQSLIDRPSVSIYFRVVHGLTMASFAMIYLIVFLTPIMSGIYFMYDAKAQISGNYPDLQFWSVFAATFLSGMMIVVSFAFYNLDNDEVAGKK